MVGIGGIGVSALAKFLVAQGATVTGSDQSSSHIITDLVQNYNITVGIGSDPHVITADYQYLVYSPAIAIDDEERIHARKLGIPEYSYPEVLGTITRNKKTVTVSGTNGKTTTTTMIIELLDVLGAHPSGIVGEMLQKFNSNYIQGDSELFVAEACEYRDSFLNLNHDIAVFTNITPDHLDYFRDLAHIQDSFIRYLDNKKGTGVLVCNTKLPNLAPVVAHARHLGMLIIPYQDFLGDDLSVRLPGEHNRQNAAAALAVINHLGYDITRAREYLALEFKGAKRRLEFIGTTTSGTLVYDDYAHNPEGLEFLIAGLHQRFPDKKVIVIFEPHLYSRTRDFKETFAEALAHADHVFLFPVYRAREPENHLEDFLLAPYLEKLSASFTGVTNPTAFKVLFTDFNYKDDVVVVTAGAGPIWKVGKELLN